MKTRLTILLLALLFTNSAKADDNNLWFDIDFSSTTWLDNFSTAFQQLGKDPYDPRQLTTETPAIDMGLNTPITIDGFIINSPVYREPAAFTSVSGATAQYAVRFRSNPNDMSYIEFPVVDNAGRITLYVANGNGTTASTIDLALKETQVGEDFIPDVNGGWRPNYPRQQWEVPGFNEYADGAKDLQLTYDININEPVAMRICRKKGQFMKVYRIVLEKYNDGGTTIPQHERKAKLFVTGKTLHLSDTAPNASLSICDLTGKRIISNTITTSTVDLPTLQPGIYIAKLASDSGETNQKIIIR
jgi:hypothetical protein